MRARYQSFISAIDNSVAGRDQNGCSLADRVACSAEQNAADTMAERGRAIVAVNDPEYWRIALETAKFMFDDWRSNYPELRLDDA